MKTTYKCEHVFPHFDFMNGKVSNFVLGCMGVAFAKGYSVRGKPNCKSFKTELKKFLEEMGEHYDELSDRKP